MQALNRIQKELKAPKGQMNNFGGYKYRSCEDILEAVKPLLGSSTLTITDDLVLIGDRYYVKATATLVEDGNKENFSQFSVSAFARESLEKKGMDSSQITGAASSYARKYALNGLFLIDDTKDADSQKHDDANTAQGMKKKADKEFDAFMGSKPTTANPSASSAKPNPTIPTTSAQSGHIYKSCERCKKAVNKGEEEKSMEIFGQVLHIQCQPL